jgi:valyl-tRNA synthetase
LQFVSEFKPTPTLLDEVMTSGKMAIRDKFMISRLMDGIESVNNFFHRTALENAQHVSYALWLNDLCAVYLELVKPVMYDASDEQQGCKMGGASNTLGYS